MNKLFLNAAALLLVLCTAVGNLAYAQEGDDGAPFPTEERTEAPAPVNPSVKSLDSGRVMIVVGSTRNFGYRIGELIPVTVVVSADPSVHVNLEALKRKTFTTEASDFELVGTPVIVQEKRGDKNVWRIQLMLRSWVIKPVIAFNCDFHYATELLPDGKTPSWKPITTPDFLVETSNTASDASKELMVGDMEAKESPKPVLVAPLKYSGYALLSLLPLWLLVQAWKRVRPAKPLTTAELAWIVFDRVIADAQEKKQLNYAHLQQIASTLRSYLHIETVPLKEVAIPLEQFFALHDNKTECLAAAVGALTKLERALFSKLELSQQEKQLLLREIELIVPRA